MKPNDIYYTFYKKAEKNPPIQCKKDLIEQLNGKVRFLLRDEQVKTIMDTEKLYFFSPISSSENECEKWNRVVSGKLLILLCRTNPGYWKKFTDKLVDDILSEGSEKTHLVFTFCEVLFQHPKIRREMKEKTKDLRYYPLLVPIKKLLQAMKFLPNDLCLLITEALILSVGDNLRPFFGEFMKYVFPRHDKWNSLHLKCFFDLVLTTKQISLDGIIDFRDNCLKLKQYELLEKIEFLLPYCTKYSDVKRSNIFNTLINDLFVHIVEHMDPKNTIFPNSVLSSCCNALVGIFRSGVYRAEVSINHWSKRITSLLRRVRGRCDSCGYNYSKIYNLEAQMDMCVHPSFFSVYTNIVEVNDYLDSKKTVSKKDKDKDDFMLDEEEKESDDEDMDDEEDQPIITHVESQKKQELPKLPKLNEFRDSVVIANEEPEFENSSSENTLSKNTDVITGKKRVADTSPEELKDKVDVLVEKKRKVEDTEEQKNVCITTEGVNLKLPKNGKLEEEKVVQFASEENVTFHIGEGEDSDFLNLENFDGGDELEDFEDSSDIKE